MAKSSYPFIMKIYTGFTQIIVLPERTDNMGALIKKRKLLRPFNTNTSEKPIKATTWNSKRTANQVLLLKSGKDQKAWLQETL